MSMSEIEKGLYQATKPAKDDVDPYLEGCRMIDAVYNYSEWLYDEGREKEAFEWWILARRKEEKMDYTEGSLEGETSRRHCE